MSATRAARARAAYEAFSAHVGIEQVEWGVLPTVVREGWLVAVEAAELAKDVEPKPLFTTTKEGEP